MTIKYPKLGKKIKRKAKRSVKLSSSVKPKPKKVSKSKSKFVLREDSPPYRVNGNGHHHKLKFIDLFCGIGGFHIAFERAGCECVFSCDWNEKAQETYAANFGVTPYSDLRTLPSSEIPDHDILCAGFPCQPFSIAGVSKKNALNKPHGFLDETQGTLFFELARIIKDKRPKAFLLENVKNLRSHDKGRTYEVIMSTLKDDLGYPNSFNAIRSF